MPSSLDCRWLDGALCCSFETDGPVFLAYWQPAVSLREMTVHWVLGRIKLASHEASSGGRDLPDTPSLTGVSTLLTYC